MILVESSKSHETLESKYFSKGDASPCQFRYLPPASDPNSNMRVKAKSISALLLVDVMK